MVLYGVLPFNLITQLLGCDWYYLWPNVLGYKAVSKLPKMTVYIGVSQFNVNSHFLLV